MKTKPIHHNFLIGLDEKVIKLYEKQIAQEKKPLESYLKGKKKKILKRELHLKYFLKYITANNQTFQKRRQVEIAFLKRKTAIGKQLETLEIKAYEGDIQGLKDLAFLAVEATNRLNEWARTYPGYLANTAESMTVWPILVTEKSARDKKIKDLLNDIRLDTSYSSGIPTTKILTTLVESKKWALNLFQAILSARFGLEENHNHKRKKYSHQNWYWHLESLLLILKLPTRDELLLEAEYLKPISKSSSKSWWKLAKKILRLTIKHRPLLTANLSRIYGRTDKVQNAQSGNNKTQGLITDEIVEEVRKSFTALIHNYKPYQWGYSTTPPFIIFSEKEQKILDSLNISYQEEERDSTSIELVDEWVQGDA